MTLDPIESVIDDVRAGRTVVIIDAKDRENEGDLMVAAELITPEAINFMVQEGKGLICLSLTEERLSQLQIPLQVTENTAPLGTNFTVSIDLATVAECGVTAAARAATIRAAVDETKTRRDFVMPGYVFPLSAHRGGVLRRSGQTEGSVDLARLAGLKPAGVICEIMGSDGSMLRGAELAAYCRRFGLRITSVEEIARYRLQHEVSLRPAAEYEIRDFSGLGIPGAAAEEPGEPLRVVVFVDDADGKEQLAFIKGRPANGCLVRIHSECLTGDVFGSERCDCGPQFIEALAAIFREGSGVVVYLHQEGRGIGLGNKLRAYELQDKGRDTVDANLELGFAADLRDYRAGAHILSSLGLSSVRLMTNNPAKVRSLEQFDIVVQERVPLITKTSKYNRLYLDTKRERLGHLF